MRQVLMITTGSNHEIDGFNVTVQFFRIHIYQPEGLPGAPCSLIVERGILFSMSDPELSVVTTRMCGLAAAGAVLVLDINSITNYE